MVAKLGKFLKFSLFLLTFLYSLSAISEEKDLNISLSWEKDFELILELQGVPTRAEVKLAEEKEAFLRERERLEEERLELEKRLEILKSPIYSDKLYDEMLKEGTNDISSTKESILKKLEDIKQKIEEIDRKLKKLK